MRIVPTIFLLLFIGAAPSTAPATRPAKPQTFAEIFKGFPRPKDYGNAAQVSRSRDWLKWKRGVTVADFIIAASMHQEGSSRDLTIAVRGNRKLPNGDTVFATCYFGAPIPEKLEKLKNGERLHFIGKIDGIVNSSPGILPTYSIFVRDARVAK